MKSAKFQTWLLRASTLPVRDSYAVKNLNTCQGQAAVLQAKDERSPWAPDITVRGREDIDNSPICSLASAGRTDREHIGASLASS